MTELYLNDTQVVFDNSESVKITKENPYFISKTTGSAGGFIFFELRIFQRLFLRRYECGGTSSYV